MTNECKYAIFNPHNKLIEKLPVIYGYNYGGPSGWMNACLIAEDGTALGGHLCSEEWFMEGDLGILEGSRPDRHETFKSHYPDGYRMDFVSGDIVRARTHKGLEKAFKLNYKVK